MRSAALSNKSALSAAGMILTLLLLPLAGSGATQYKGTVSDSGSQAKLDSVKVRVKRAATVVCSTYTNSQGQFSLSFTSGVTAPLASVGNAPVLLGFDARSKTVFWSGKHTVALTLYTMQGAVVASSRQLTGAQSCKLPMLPNGVYILQTIIDGVVSRGKLLLSGNTNAAIDMASQSSLKRVGKVLSVPDTLIFTKGHFITKKVTATAGDTSLAVKLVSLNTIPAVRIFSPNGGESYRVGDSIIIKYQANPDSDVSKAYLSLLVGPSSYELCDTCYGNGTSGFPVNEGQVTTFAWHIPDTIYWKYEWWPMPTSTQCKVRITDYNLRWSDVSDSAFAILPKQ